MSKEHLIMWKAIERGWQSSDLKRINKKIHELWKDFNCSIPFGDVYDLALMLDEPIDYKLEWSLIRLCKEGVIDIFKKDDFFYLDLIDFNSPYKDLHNNKRSAKHVSLLAKEGDNNSDGELSF